jgi:hypothetical protein
MIGAVRLNLQQASGLISKQIKPFNFAAAPNPPPLRGSPLALSGS